MNKKIFPASLLSTIYYLLSTSPIRAVDISEVFLLQPGSTVRSKFPDINTIISNLLPNIYILSGVILLFILLGGGYMIISSGGNPENIEKGKQAAISAIIGFVIIFMSYWIIQIIEQLTGLKILDSTILNTIL